MTERPPLTGLAPFPPPPPPVRAAASKEELARLLMHPLLPYLVGPYAQPYQQPYQQPFYPFLPPYVFQANSLGQTPETPNDTNALRRRRKARKAEGKEERKDKERPRTSSVRLRDEDGRFLPSKQARTNTLDLQLRLDTSQGEVQKLREDLRLKEERVNALEERLRVMEEERKLREQMLTLDPVHDIQLIRDYKMRQQYLAQLQHVAQQRFGSLHASSSPSSTTTPMEQVHSPSSGTPYSPAHERSDSHMARSAGEDEHGMDSMSMSPPATWQFDPYSQDVPKPFREKIDLSKIELRPVEPPPNLVEHARMEYYEGERQWQQQQESVQRHLSERQYWTQGPQRAAQPVPPLPAYATKIDLNEKISQLRKTAQPPSRHGSQQSLDLTGGTDPMLTDDVFSDHAFFEHVLGDSAMGDELDFLSIPTPTARIWRDELERKGHSS